MIQLLAFDLDGTLTQHRTPLEGENRVLLTRLAQKYRCLMVGAGGCQRIFNQMEAFPIDIIGNYGMEQALYNKETKDLFIHRDPVVQSDKASVLERAQRLREKYGYTEFKGESVEFHASGMVTFALIGTKALIEDKLSFDPVKAKRRVMYKEVIETFPEFNVFIGGSSSFDMAPKPYNKFYALDRFCRENGIAHKDVVYFGDDYEKGGNDQALYESDFPFVVVDDYRNFKSFAAKYLD